MAQELNFVSGEFEGYFYTHQHSPLGASESLPGGSTHAVHVYKGKLSAAASLPHFDAREHLDNSGLLLHNVTNIEIQQAGSAGVGTVCEFEQLVLKDVRVERSWELNGKTYGILKGTLFGKIKARTSTIPPPPVPPVKSTPEPPRIPTVTPVPVPPVTPLLPVPPSPGPGSGGGGGVGGTGRRGCLDTIWNILKWLLLLLMLYLLLTYARSCCQKKKSVLPPDNSCCMERDSLAKRVDSLEQALETSRLEQEEAQQRTDSVQTELEERKKRDGAQNGVITASLMWQSKDDLDIAIEQPNGQLVFFKAKYDFSHDARLDVDANQSEQDLADEPIENIYIKSPEAGRYKVYVNWYINRSGLPELPYYLQIRIKDQVIDLNQKKYEVRKSQFPKLRWDVVYEFEYNN